MTPEERFTRIAGFYEALKTVSIAIRTQKGGIALENYVGRFFAADTLEMLVAYGEAVSASNSKLKPMAAKYAEEFEKVKDLITPTNKPIYEMSLEEFERVMNI